MATVPKLSIIIVSFNTKDHLCRCLRSLEGDHEIIVVDNASSDGSVEMVKAEFPHVRLIESGENLGFGRANNLGLDAATCELALLLNSDIVAANGAVEHLAEVFSDPSVVAAGGRLLHEDGSLQDSAANELTLWSVFCEQTGLEKVFPNSRVLSPYWVTRRIDDRYPTPVFQVMGACLMFRPVERFDGNFFLYCEDTELCHRLTQHGLILYVPGAEFVHALGASSAGDRWKAVARYNSGKELYFRLHHGAIGFLACLVLNRIGALLRVLVFGISAAVTLGMKRPIAKKAGLFIRVLFAPIYTQKALL